MKLDVGRGRAIVLLVALCTACSDSTGWIGPEISLVYGVAPEVTLPPAALHIAIGVQRVVLRDPATGLSFSSSRAIHGFRYGTVPVSVALVTASADTLAMIELTERFEPDSYNWVHGFVGRERPLGFCIGALRATPIQGTESDTLFVMAGSMPKNVIC